MGMSGQMSGLKVYNPKTGQITDYFGKLDEAGFPPWPLIPMNTEF